MRTKREQVQAHRFVIRRIVSGMVQGNPEALEFPMRRTAGSMIGGLAVAILVFAGFWVVGAIFGSADWRDKPEGAVIIDQDTGATFVYLKPALYPVTDLASARLFLETADIAIYRTSSADLRDVPRGDAFGIPGAPRQLPPADALSDAPWQVCSLPKADNDKDQFSALAVHSADAAERLDGDAQLIVADDRYSLLWHDRRFDVPDPEVLSSLGLDENTDALPVDPVFREAVPVAGDLTVPEIAGSGDGHPIEGFGDADNGDFFTVADTVYVLTADGLARTSELDRLLLNNAVEPTPERLTADALAEVGTVEGTDLIPRRELPAALADLDEPPLRTKAVICAVSGDGDTTLASYPGESAPEAITSATATTEATEADDVDTAEHVWTPPGAGVLIRAQGSPAAESGTRYLVTEEKRFGLTEAAAEVLGYGAVEPVPVPWSVVALVPEGPQLSRQAVVDDFEPYPESN